MKKTTKITDVALRAGVAKSTVSNVLTGRKYVSDELKEKVMAACRELDFQPNFYASALSGHTSHIIALLLESHENVERSFYKDLIVACLQKAAEHGYALLLYYNSDSEKLLNTLRQGTAPIDGAVLVTPCVEDFRIDQMSSGHIDCVVIGRPAGALQLSYVDIDNKKLVADVTEGMISSYGKDVYLINSHSGLTISRDRADSFAAVCRAHGIDGAARMFESEQSSADDGYLYAKRVMQKGSAFITANAVIAFGVYRAATEAGWEIGKDVSVFALGRSIEHGTFFPPLSHAEQDYGVLGAKAVEMLINDIEGSAQVRRELIKSKVIVKESARF